MPPHGDLISRLRGKVMKDFGLDGLGNEAAAEVERLRAALEDAIDTLEAMDLHVDNPLYNRLTAEGSVMPTKGEHTPGPWGLTTSDPSGQWVLYSESASGPGRSQRRDVGRFIGSEANARLIAAAPDLLAALRSLVAEIRAYQSPECDDSGALGAAELRAADAAIAKATGRKRDADEG